MKSVITFSGIVIITPPIKTCQKMQTKIRNIKTHIAGILSYVKICNAEILYFWQVLTARFSWRSNFNSAVINVPNCRCDSFCPQEL